MNETMSKQDARINFTLVHGTFGARSSWLNENSDENPDGFRARLKNNNNSSEINFTVPTPWGGSSTLSKIRDLTNAARLRGAQLLSHRLSELSEDDANFIIAHSHGGNVAMYAVQEQTARSKIDGIICVATPFLYPRRRPLSITTLLLSLVIIIIGFFQFSWRYDLLNSSLTAWCMASLLFLISVIIPSALVFLIVHQRFRASAALNEHLSRLSFIDPNIPILLIRASGDEATGLLRAGQFFNWIAGIAMRIGGRQLYVLLCVGLIVFAWSIYRSFDWIPEHALSLLITIVIFIAALMVLMLIVLTVSRVFVGFDAWRWVGEIETMTEDGPPGMSSELEVLTPRVPQSGWSHTNIFMQAETVAVISQWCKKQIAKK